MEVKFSITGGTIEVEKRSFVKAMLLNGGLLKTVIYGAEKDKQLKNPPTINKEDERWVRIDYNKAEDILLESSAYELLKALKEQYKEKIRGVVTVKMMSFDAYFSMIDLNDPNSIKKV